MSRREMFAVPPTQLVQARTLSHSAVQWASRAARANIEPLADDSHSNLGWDDATDGLVSHFLEVDQQRYQLGFSFSLGSLLWLIGGEVTATLKLETSDEASAGAWCDARLSEAGLRTTDHADMPYEVRPVDYSGLAGSRSAGALETLGAWYSQAQIALQYLVVAFAEIAVSAPFIRCWPHHFDLATLFTLDEGDPEIARSIGVGLSPGDESYAEPYFYCTPWPVPEHLPAAPAPFHWHTSGFTSLVCTASRIDEATNLTEVLSSAFEIARGTLGDTN